MCVLLQIISRGFRDSRSFAEGVREYGVEEGWGNRGVEKTT